MGRVAAVTLLTEPKRRPESPAAASPPRAGQRHQRGAAERAAPARPLQPGLPPAAASRSVALPPPQPHGSGPSAGAPAPGPAQVGASRDRSRALRGARCRSSAVCSGGPRAPFAPGAAAAGQGASSAPSACRGGNPFLAPPGAAQASRMSPGKGKSLSSLPFLLLSSIFIRVLVGVFWKC